MTTHDINADELEAAYDPEMSFRELPSKFTSIIVGGSLFALSLFHYYTAGFGILVEHWHTGIHVAAVLGLIFLVFDFDRLASTKPKKERRFTLGGIPLYDWVLAILSLVTVLYFPIEFHNLAFRIGAPSTTDVAMGSILIFLVLEAARRCMGWTLPLIVSVFILYGLFGRWAPGSLIAALANPTLTCTITA